MRYRVFVEANAQDDLEQAYQWLAERSQEAAVKWYNGLVNALLGLEAHPKPCQLAPEDSVFHREIRQLLCGSYRILFTIAGHDVYVLHVRHSARDYPK